MQIVVPKPDEGRVSPRQGPSRVLAHPHPAVTVAVALAVTAVGSLGFSRATGRLGEVVQAPVGAFTLAAAVLLTAHAPARFGWAWHGTGTHWRAVLVTLTAVVVAVTAYRLLGLGTPYQSSAAEFVVVPLGEEGLFRGFVVTVLLSLLARRMPHPAAAAWAVVVAAVGFGAGHLGNLGYVPTAFVLLQAGVGTVLGLLAGWLRVRTDSLVGPVLLHGTMNVLAVV